MSQGSGSAPGFSTVYNRGATKCKLLESNSDEFLLYSPFMSMLRALVRRFAQLLFLCSACLSASVVAQSQFPESNNSQTKFSISGTVVNSVSGRPISRALVQIYTGSQRLAMTDSNGQFEFDNLPPGQTAVEVRKPGFFDERQVPPVSGMSQMATISADAKPLLLKLLPEAVIYGRVQSADGNPIENLQINLFTNRIVDGRKHLERTGVASTNDVGEFRVAGLFPGVYYLEAGPSLKSSELNASKQISHAYPALFYPGTPDLTSATPIEVPPGQQVNADFALQPARFFKISGSINGITGYGINLQLLDRLGNNNSILYRFDDAKEEFHALAPAGSYTLLATAYGAGTPLTAEMPLDVTSDLSGIRLVLSPESSIPVHVRREAVKSENLRTGGPAVPLLRLIDTGGPDARVYSVITSGDPRNPSLVIQNLSPGKYYAEVGGDGPWYVQSAQCGDIDLLRDELTVTAGVQNSPIEILLRDDGASLQVRTNSTQAQRTVIMLVPDNGSSVRAETAMGNGGAVEIQNLAPGSYSVLAFAHAEGLEYKNPEVLSRYMSRASRVVLQPNQHSELDIQLVPLDE